jgi:hypothetical protein
MTINNKNIKRFLRVSWLRLRRHFSTAQKPRKPKSLTANQKTAVAIYIKVLHDPASKLYYDLTTQECYIRSGDSTLYLFLEADNLKIINSVYGYDVAIDGHLEAYLGEKFRREMSVRRQAFKNEALSRVSHSLDKTLEKITQ